MRAHLPLIRALLNFIAVFWALSALSAILTPAPAAAAEPWWHVISSSRPSYLPPGGEGTIVASVENFGDLRAGSEKSPVKIADVLPAGLKAIAITGAKWFGNSFTALSCSLPALSCSLESPLAPYQQMEVRIRVKVQEGAQTGELNRVSVSGGGAPTSTLQRPITVSEEAVPFGVEDFELRAEEEGGALSTQAGSHPFQVTGTFVFNQEAEKTGGGGKPEVFPAGLPKDIDTLVPPGLIGDPTPLGTCTLPQFSHMRVNGESGVNLEENECPASTAIGMAAVTVEEPGLIGYTSITVPVFNLEPAFGEPARFGFVVPLSGATITLDTALRSGPGEDYGVTVSSLNTTEQVGTLSAQVSLWGVPGDPRHDNSRGWACLFESEGLSHGLCTPSTDRHPPAFLTMPTSCSGPLQASAQVNSWASPADFKSFFPSEALQSLDGCNRLSFSPSVSAKPSTNRASAPSGLDVNLDFHDEGLTSAEGLSQSHLKDSTVTLPEGLTVNPSAGVGLAGCRPSEYARETIGSAPGEGCPNSSKLGTVEVTTPLLPVAIHGSLYIAQPYENPFGSLIALYVVLKNPEKGILIKLAGRVSPDPLTGRLTTSFLNNPPVAFDHFNFHFREGQQAPLITPPTCGTYETQAQLVPYSEPSSLLSDFSPFQITEGFDGGPCPTGVPFAPQLQAGMLGNNAASFSPFSLHLTRSDADAEISSFSTDMPPGLSGVLTGIPYCPESDIALARTKSGSAEEASPSCPQGSLLGHSLVGTGVGAVLAYTPGKVYLAGPYNGDPFSLLSVTSAVVGPFDLGTVVIRFGLRIDPHTTQVSVDPTASEPIPTIIQGIVTHVRDIRVMIDRPDFTLNPTSCDPMAISSTVAGNTGQRATISSRFQATNCQALKFAPKFSVSTSSKTSKANGASLSTKLAYPPNSLGSYANIAKVKVQLPKELPSRLTTLQKACTNAQFEANPAGCPAASFIGHATVHTQLLPVPLSGPAIFVSHGGEAFPSLEVVLQGDGVTVELIGTTLIKKGVTSTTFRSTPDAPFSTFELTLPQGPYSALAANADLCASKLTMPSEFLAQNGALLRQNTPIAVSGCKKHKPTRKELLAKALKACHKKHGKKRAACERQARRRYGAAKKAGKRR